MAPIGMNYGKFKIQKGDLSGTVVKIEAVPFFLGRLETNDLVVLDEKASRQHAKIEIRDEDLYIVDLESRNGLYINGEKKKLHRLASGDQIGIGSSQLIYENNEVDSRAEEPTQEDSEIQNISVAIHPLLKLLRAQLPPKAIATQIMNFMAARFHADLNIIVWKGYQAFSMVSTKQNATPEIKSAPLPSWIDETTTSTDIIHIEKDGTYLISPFYFDAKNLGWIVAKKEAGKPAFNQKDKTDFHVLRLISECALERTGHLNEIQEAAKKQHLMGKYVSPEILKDVFSREYNLESSPLDVEEKEVTVLFTDIQGFTSLSERLPPKEIADLLNEYFQRMVQVISQHHGSVNKFIGDAIMALFGAPASRGNDAAHAVNAAIGMIEALKLFWKDVVEAKRFNMRIGINTGKVVVGNIGSLQKMEYTVLGDSVNVASRLESLASPNGIMIGKRTADLVSSQFELEYIPSLKVKGKSQEIEVYKVLGRRTA